MSDACVATVAIEVCVSHQFMCVVSEGTLSTDGVEHAVEAGVLGSEAGEPALALGAGGGRAQHQCGQRHGQHG